MKPTPFFISLLIPLLFFSCSSQNQKESKQENVAAGVLPIEDITMYEIFVRNFSSEGTFNAIIPQLDRIKKLGVNVIWLMPIQPLGKLNHKGTYGSPYSIQNYTEVNPDFGTKADFKKLVDSIHAKGMYIILDEVANHTAWDNPWITSHPEWYTHDSVTGKIISPVKDWTDVADLNYDNIELRKQMIHDLKYWIDSFKIDGYRCDAAHMVPDDFWKQAISILRQDRPIIMLAESEDSSMYSDGFDMTYSWSVYHALKDVWNGKRTTATVDSMLQKEKAKFPANFRSLRFIDNHDENSWDNVPEVKFINRDGAKAAFFATITIPGTPLVYNGQEVGYPTKMNLFEKYSIDFTANPELQQWYSTILNFYDHSDVLKKGTLDEFDSENKTVLIYERKLLGQDPLWVIVNTQNSEVVAQLPSSLQNKKMQDLISGEGIASATTMKLRPFEYHILKVK